ncbi:MAG: hypothetical protein IRY83_02910 [Chloroflexi bacterium]|nr:hypothetical protein [Chloroflexota bacterium]
MERFSPDDQPENHSGSAATRRRLLARGVQIAAALPAAVIATGVDSALAHPGKHDDDHRNAPNGPVRFGPPFRGLRLVRVADVQVGDFSAVNPGSDSLRSGEVRVFPASNGQSSRVWVHLAGARANTTYNVAFVRLNDHGREDLGTIVTRASGNFAGFTTTMLGGVRRAGTFVIATGGQDEFVTIV